MGAARYFDAMNLGHAVAHELVAAQDQADRRGPVSVADLPLRAALGDPCQLSQRSALTAVASLTLRGPRTARPRPCCTGATRPR